MRRAYAHREKGRPRGVEAFGTFGSRLYVVRSCCYRLKCEHTQRITSQGASAAAAASGSGAATACATVHRSASRSRRNSSHALHIRPCTACGEEGHVMARDDSSQGRCVAERAHRVAACAPPRVASTGDMRRSLRRSSRRTIGSPLPSSTPFGTGSPRTIRFAGSSLATTPGRRPSPDVHSLIR